MRDVLWLVAVLVGGLVFPAPARAGDEIVGAMWKIELKDVKDPIVLQCTEDGKVFGPKGKPLGTWEAKGALATIKVKEDSPRGGTYKITQLGKKPPSFRGIFIDNKGNETKIKVTMEKD